MKILIFNSFWNLFFIDKMKYISKNCKKINWCFTDFQIIFQNYKAVITMQKLRKKTKTHFFSFFGSRNRCSGNRHKSFFFLLKNGLSYFVATMECILSNEILSASTHRLSPPADIFFLFKFTKPFTFSEMSKLSFSSELWRYLWMARRMTATLSYGMLLTTMLWSSAFSIGASRGFFWILGKINI